MSQVTFEELLEAGSHFGHLTRKWNPAMAPYIFKEMNGIHIIDLHKTVVKLEEATAAARKLAAQGRTILFVGTKKQAQGPIAEAAQACGMPYVTERWPGGMLTNFPTIRRTVAKMDQIDNMMKDGTFDNLSKRERLQVTRQRAKLETNFGSIRDMKMLPAAIFVVDVMREHIAIHEAVKLGIPIFAITDTNSDPKSIDFVIPANDDATTSVALISNAMSEAIKEGVMERKMTLVDKGDEETDLATDGAPKRRERRHGVRKERIKSEDKEAMNARIADKFNNESDDEEN